jgi:predicted transcriptional regulator
MYTSYYSNIYQSDLPHRAVSVYMYLKDRANKDNKCFPAIGTIAKELKLSRSTIKRAITDLEKSGHLSKEQRWRENGGRSSSLYELK